MTIVRADLVPDLHSVLLSAPSRIYRPETIKTVVRSGAALRRYSFSILVYGYVFVYGRICLHLCAIVSFFVCLPLCASVIKYLRKWIFAFCCAPVLVLVPGKKFQVLPTVFALVCSNKAAGDKFLQPGSHLLFSRDIQWKQKGSKNLWTSVVKAEVVSLNDQTVEQDFSFSRQASQAFRRADRFF